MIREYSFFISLVTLCTFVLISCDPVSSIGYRIKNSSKDTIYVYANQNNFNYQIIRKSKYNSISNENPITICPKEVFEAYLWSYGSRLSDSDMKSPPFWQYIESIIKSDKELDPESWNNGDNWEKHTNKSHLSEDIRYDFTIE